MRKNELTPLNFKIKNLTDYKIDAINLFGNKDDRVSIEYGTHVIKEPQNWNLLTLKTLLCGNIYKIKKISFNAFADYPKFVSKQLYAGIKVTNYIIDDNGNSGNDSISKTVLLERRTITTSDISTNILLSLHTNLDTKIIIEYLMPEMEVWFCLYCKHYKSLM
ncbi:MAG: hypothetical protein WCT77_08580 [Bacteroidota bacterium]